MADTMGHFEKADFSFFFRPLKSKKVTVDRWQDNDRLLQIIFRDATPEDAVVKWQENAEK